MPATFFVVRAVVEPHLREKLEHWYANDHLPWASRVFKCEKAWRCWSARDEGVHYAVYRFTEHLVRLNTRKWSSPTTAPSRAYCARAML